MRIVIDMQGAQTESRYRGIGRYAHSFAEAVARNRGGHEILLALNGSFPHTIEPLRAAFDDLLPQDNLRVWRAPGPVRAQQPGNDGRREAAELLREAFLASLRPDVIHVSSLFEGYLDDAVTSIDRFDHVTPVTVTLHDLIPLLDPKRYLTPDPPYAKYYRRKIAHLEQAEACLAVSESSRQEVLKYLKFPENRVFNTSEGADSCFRPLPIEEGFANETLRKFGFGRPFVLYSGGADERKNLPRLIEAYAALPKELRKGHQLLLAGRMPEMEIARLQRQGRSNGLESDEFRFAGYVDDEELIRLYNLCALFVLPSWHEGFGLPALEAMACGAPVIGADAASLPEVIGCEEALFDPFDVAAIAAKMAQALGDESFRARLRAHGSKQAKQFSWDKTAQRAITAWESLPAAAKIGYPERSLGEDRLYRALAPNIPRGNDRSLIALSACLAQNRQAGLERQLFLDISELSQRDAATGIQRVVRSYLKWLLYSPPAGFRVEPVFATHGEGYRYARRYTRRFLGLGETDVSDDPIRWQRGDLFFGLDMQHHVQLAHRGFYRRLRREGVIVKFLVYDLLPIQLPDLFDDSNAKALHEHWLGMVAETDGAICISRATADAFDHWIKQKAAPRPGNFQNTWVHIGADIEGAAPSRGLPSDAATVLEAMRARPSFLSVATLEPRKRQRQIIDACERLWGKGADIDLVLVGGQGWKVDALAGRIRSHPENGKRLFWLQGISDEYLGKVYGASTCLVAASLDEGFGLPLIEVARHGLPVIARDIPVFREVAGDGAYYFQGETASQLADALEDWLALYREGAHPKPDRICWSTWREATEKLKGALLEQHYPRRQLLVDISELVQRDAGSGIQRVVRSILGEWLRHPPPNYRIEPVYATLDGPYRYARRFTARFLGLPAETLSDDVIDQAPGDIFFGLDLQPPIQAEKGPFYRDLRARGVTVKFLVHDLLGIRMPRYFPAGNAEGFARWLDVVGESDGAVCVSKTTADDLAAWIESNGPSRQRPFDIDWSHNGADFDGAAPDEEQPPDAAAVPEAIRNRPGFLMIGTLEPRKGHGQVLEAFERLWESGIDANLVIVGKQGWMVGDLVERLRTHAERDKRLFWLEKVSDAYLKRLYAASACLIAASYGEGGGLPLIEAARHGLPILARDIPVFREVAGEYAYFFDAETPDRLAEAIQTWLGLFEKGRHPKSAKMPRLSWKESARRLMDLLIGGDIDTKEKQ
uniref:Glycosyltransferase involved in cell wall bisynthesis n=1 Tax=Candidatus Kentrum sp. TC TaxID=2126339 RepID=A0A450YEJ9_9GAMM|nr:MAG: Glycosyltransferase involved in cell wall bisynthesis [Candidatus Kentron sp. TC]